MYEYKVLELLRVVDGDTLDLRLDVGFHLTTALRFRLYGVDCAEKRSPNEEDRILAAKATAFTREWVERALVDQGITAQTYKTDSFGRWLVWLNPNNGGPGLNVALVMEGLGVAVG